MSYGTMNYVGLDIQIHSGFKDGDTPETVAARVKEVLSREFRTELEADLIVEVAESA